MKKIAFFVEGSSEQFFVEKLLVEIFGKNKISITTIKISGGSNTPIKKHTYPPTNPQSDLIYCALIYDCGSDSTVKSYILEERVSLIKANFVKIIGLLDLYPKARADFNKFKNGLYYRTPTKDIEIKFILSIMEIESWFLGEDSHFEKIDPNLNVPLIEKNLGFNPKNENMENRDTPAIDLKSCYALVGKSYTKKLKHISRTVEALDYCYLYMERQTMLLSLGELISEIESIFETEVQQ